MWVVQGGNSPIDAPLGSCETTITLCRPGLVIVLCLLCDLSQPLLMQAVIVRSVRVVGLMNHIMQAVCMRSLSCDHIMQAVLLC